jgi:hypothetical protein
VAAVAEVVSLAVEPMLAGRLVANLESGADKRADVF